MIYVVTTNPAQQWIRVFSFHSDRFHRNGLTRTKTNIVCRRPRCLQLQVCWDIVWTTRLSMLPLLAFVFFNAWDKGLISQLHKRRCIMARQLLNLHVRCCKWKQSRMGVRDDTGIGSCIERVRLHRWMNRNGTRRHSYGHRIWVWRWGHNHRVIHNRPRIHGPSSLLILSIKALNFRF